MRRDDGYIVVETAGAFVPFVLLVISILSLVNIVTLQARIHYALTQTAGTLSMYCYTAQAIGIADEIAAMEGRANNFNNTLDSMLGGINALSGSGGSLDDIEGMFDTATGIISDPVDMMKNLANFGLSGLRNDVSAAMVTPLVMRYLGGNSSLAYDYLDRVRVVSFEITDCAIINHRDDVKLTAEYEVLYTFWGLRLPFTPTLRISQTVVTKAWLGGSGTGYRRS